MDELKHRVDREARSFNAETLRRNRYEEILHFANNGPARIRRDNFVCDVMKRTLNKDILEIGSQGWTSCFAKFGIAIESLTCINISGKEIEKGQKSASKLNYNIKFRLMDAHFLGFPDASFDLVYGVAILHHLDIHRVMKEIYRVLRPGGEILFIEPLRFNPIAKIIRFLTPKARTSDELPLGKEELQIIEIYFVRQLLYTELFHFPAAVLSQIFFHDAINPLTIAFDKVDEAILRIAPAFGPFYRTVTIHGKRRTEANVI